MHVQSITDSGMYNVACALSDQTKHKLFHDCLLHMFCRVRSARLLTAPIP